MFKSLIFLLFSELRMAVVLSDLRQHLEGQLAAKKTALVETEESLRFVSRISSYSLLPLLILPCCRKYVGDRAVDNQQGGRGVMRNRITAPGAGTLI